MTTQEIQLLSTRITAVLENQQLKTAIHLLRSLLEKLQNWQLLEKLDSLENTYNTLLHYWVEGAQDPERQKMYLQLLHSLYQIVDKTVFQFRTSQDAAYFYESKRLASYPIEKPKNLLIFNEVWLSNAWTKDDETHYKNLLNDKDTDETIAGLFITALILNLLEIFDKRKAALLLEAAQHENPEISERACVGLTVFLRKYDRRFHLYPDLNERLNQLADDPKFARKLRHILLQFILSRDTEKITRKITDELLPEMMQKVGPKIGQKIKRDEALSDFGIYEDEKNPEWQNIIEEAGLQEKLIEISEWQMEGADVMHSSFIHLKNYPFFNELGNWFLPFALPKEGIENEELAKLAEILKAATILCNSDKYSFYMSISQMPESYRKVMINQFSLESTTLKEMEKEDLPGDSNKIDFRTRQYIQDLYRFYKLHPRKKDFEDIFEQKPEFYQVKSIERLVGNTENLTIIGEYYFNRNHWEEAQDVFDKLLNISQNDVLYQKKAYCLQMMGNLEVALETYQKAELLNANHSWTIKKLAYLHRVLKHWEEALFYYKKAEQLNPKNLNIQLNVGHCYLELKDYESALKQYFKVEYLSENKEKAWRAIAWTSFRMSKYQQASEYFNRLLEIEPQVSDLLNAGHVQSAIGNRKEAIRFYVQAWKTANQSPEEFSEIFTHDIPELVAAGVKEEEISLLLDSVFL